MYVFFCFGRQQLKPHAKTNQRIIYFPICVFMFMLVLCWLPFVVVIAILEFRDHISVEKKNGLHVLSISVISTSIYDVKQ